MKKKALMLGVVAVLIAEVSVADTYVKGYHRSDGTYVKGHYRSSPNAARYDNYSSKGNRNPYTGKKGAGRHEFSTPSIYDYRSGKRYDR